MQTAVIGTVAVLVPHLFFSVLHDLFSDLLLEKGVSNPCSQEQH